MNDLLYTVKYYYYHLIYKHVRYLYIVFYKRKKLAEKRVLARNVRKERELLVQGFERMKQRLVTPPEPEPEINHVSYGRRSNNSIWDTNDPRFKKAEKIMNERIRNIDRIVNKRVRNIDDRLNELLRRYE